MSNTLQAQQSLTPARIWTHSWEGQRLLLKANITAIALVLCTAGEISWVQALEDSAQATACRPAAATASAAICCSDAVL